MPMSNKTLTKPSKEDWDMLQAASERNAKKRLSRWLVNVETPEPDDLTQEEWETVRNALKDTILAPVAENALRVALQRVKAHE